MYHNLLQKFIKINNDTTVSIPVEIFNQLLMAALEKKNEFDEEFYLLSYPDVAEAIKKKEISSGFEHFLKTGYFENRKPRRFIVDESFYINEHPDVAKALKEKKIISAQAHYDARGFEECRSPYKNFSLF